jgi:hypothetical protein
VDQVVVDLAVEQESAEVVREAAQEARAEDPGAVRVVAVAQAQEAAQGALAEVARAAPVGRALVEVDQALEAVAAQVRAAEVRPD